MKYIFVALSGLLSLALAAPSQLSARETLQQATDRLLFSTSITGFETARTARNPAGLDWTSDGCSDSPDNPFGFDFIFSCHRHDFGYRNFKAQSRFTDANKARVDSNFLNDMRNQCATEGNAFEVAACRGVASVYHDAVVEFGKKRAVEIERMMKERSVEE